MRGGGISIKLFLSNRSSSDLVTLIAGGLYPGVEIALDKENSIYLYFIKDNALSTHLMACFDDAFDFLPDPPNDADGISRSSASWPVTMGLLANGPKERCKDCALVRIQDMDDGRTKWFLSAVLSHADYQPEAELFCEQTIAAIGKLENAIMLLIEEISMNRPEMFPKHAKAACKGYISGLLTSLFGG